MKKYILLALLLLIASVALFAQAPPLPPPDATPLGSDAPSGGASLGNGISITMMLSAGYMIARNFFFPKKQEEVKD